MLAVRTMSTILRTHIRFQVKTEAGQETPARTGLGSTTVLAVVTVGFGFVGKNKQPTSGYVTGKININTGAQLF